EGTFGDLSQDHGLAPLPDTALDFKTVTAPPRGVYFIRIHGVENCKHSSGFYDYIGLSSAEGTGQQAGIYGRVADHYRKIVGLPGRGDIKKVIWDRHRPDLREKLEDTHKYFKDQKFENYASLREFFNKGAKTSDSSGDGNWSALPEEVLNKLTTLASIRKFFEKNVRFSYNAYTPSKKSGSGNDRVQEEVAKAEGLALAAYIKGHGKIPFLNVRNELASLEGLDKILG
ncbi:MAG: hypothetical protein VXX88_04505, partial [Pseudomonadota bacterium]|nr:hypothetical protein [Pseudomonadota bacterium]